MIDRGLRPFADATLHYDGGCGVCHRAVRFALAEAPAAGLRFRPMQRDGTLAARDAASWRLVEAHGECFEKTAAVIRLLRACGGTWSLLGCGMKLVPERLRDVAYDVLARHRRRLARVPDTLCPVVDARLRQRFL